MRHVNKNHFSNRKLRMKHQRGSQNQSAHTMSENYRGLRRLIDKFDQFTGEFFEWNASTAIVTKNVDTRRAVPFEGPRHGLKTSRTVAPQPIQKDGSHNVGLSRTSSNRV